jgi:uncharacterized sulfatase
MNQNVLTLAALMLVPLPALYAADTSKPSKPNIIVIYTDDHGYADLGCQGIMKDVKTPNIDSLAAAGVRMTAGYVTAPQCSPSRCGLISGQYQNKFGMEDNGSWKADPSLLPRFYAMNNLPKRMKSAGYVTGMAGKSHLGSDDSAELVKLGFDKSFFKHSNGPGHWNMDLTGKDIPPQEQKSREFHLETISSFACAFIERFKAKPFFFFIAYRAPHVPLDAPQKYLDRFPGKMQESRRKALGAIAAVDDGIGRVLETLRKNKLEENSLVFVISDNGAPLKINKPDTGEGWDGSLNDPLNGEKGMLTEGGIRTPYVVQWKGTIPGGQVYSNAVISLDVAATANAVAGLPDDPVLDGVNLIPFLTGKKEGLPHEALYWRWDGQAAIRKNAWKYLTCGDRHYLFNLATDPEEKHNVYAQQPETARELRTQLNQWGQTLMPKGLGPVEMSRAARRYYDFYLDGKLDEEPVSTAPSRNASKPISRRAKAKTAATMEDAHE